MANKSGGMPEGMKQIMGWVLGVGIIAFVALIMVIIFGNLQGNVGFGQTSASFENQTINLSQFGAIPAGADNRVNANYDNSTIVIHNASDGVIIEAGNGSITGVTFFNETAFGGFFVNVTYTVNFDSRGLIDSNNIILNYTKSATNTSAQFPTVGTIIGIALLLLILIALLIFAIRKMMGVAGASGSSGSSSSSNSNFGSDRGFS